MPVCNRNFLVEMFYFIRYPKYGEDLFCNSLDKLVVQKNPKILKIIVLGLQIFLRFS